jgi:hypothetical protein
MTITDRARSHPLVPAREGRAFLGWAFANTDGGNPWPAKPLPFSPWRAAGSAAPGCGLSGTRFLPELPRRLRLPGIFS